MFLWDKVMSVQSMLISLKFSKAHVLHGHKHWRSTTWCTHAMDYSWRFQSAHSDHGQARSRFCSVTEQHRRYILFCHRAAQKADFAWFKEAWDDAMLEAHDSEWGHLFAMQVQNILDQITAGVTNAFSVMMHTETCRMLRGPALRL